MIVDAHHHLWRIGQNGHEWPTPNLGAIYRDFDAAELNAVLTGTGVDATVLVQSQPADADTQWMLAVAAAIPTIRGVVGWTDLAAPDAPQRIAELARRPKLKGLRPMLQGLPQDDWITQAAVQPALKAMVEHGLTFDALVFTRHLPFIADIARAYPDLAIVIDHGAKPPIATPEHAPLWRQRVAEVAAFPNVFCKLSGLVVEMAPDQPMSTLTAYADHLLAEFGAERLIWGSDWPVVDLRSDYRIWLDWTLDWLSGQPERGKKAILAENARKFYYLD